MNKLLLALLSLSLLGATNVSLAAGSYEDVPPGDAQFRACVTYANKIYEGGNEKSPVKGQTKVVAFCECLWNETPDNFRGSLVKFAESEKGKKVNKICEKYSNWAD